MKLLFCRECCDAFVLLVKKDRSCQCGKTRGMYTDGLNAVCTGRKALRFAIDNNSFISRMNKNKDTRGIYDQMHGKGRVQCWIMEDKDSANYLTYKKLSKANYEKAIKKSNQRG